MVKDSKKGPGDASRVLAEPIRRPMLWAGVTALLLAGIPWYVPAGAIEPVILGLPLWVWVAVAATVATCGYLHWVIARRWHLVEDLEEATGSSIGPDTQLSAGVPADGPRGR